MGNGKKITNSALIGDGGVALIHQRVFAMGHVWRELGMDAGLDGMIELRDPATGEVSNRHLLVQSKASDRPFPGETDERFFYTCDDRDIEYWMKAKEPVLLICSHPTEGSAYWVHIQNYFADPARRANGRVDFDKATMGFDGDISARLFAIADPHGQAHTPVPDRLRETLVSNLLPVDMPEVVYSYGTTRRKRWQVRDVQKVSGLRVRDDYALWSGRLISWTPADGTGLADAVEGEPTVRSIDELLKFEQDGERLVVQLLNNALCQDLKEYCDFHGRRKFLYFRATDDLAERKWNVSGNARGRSVFKGHAQKTNRDRISFYRHAALEWQFIRIEADWYCCLTPNYYFSRDGHKDSLYTAEHLRKIKQIERNTAVMQETKMWASILRPKQTLFEQAERILDFGELVTFSTELGINDALWKPVSADELPGETLFGATA